MIEVVLFIYLSGVIASMIVWSIRQFKGDASLVETMVLPDSIFVELGICI